MNRLLLAYMIFSNICVIAWACMHPNVLKTSDIMDIFRKYIISVTVGVFVMIPFLFIMSISEIMSMKGSRLQREGNTISDTIKMDLKINGDKHAKEFSKVVERYQRKCARYDKYAIRYKLFLDINAKNMAYWLRDHYI